MLRESTGARDLFGAVVIPAGEEGILTAGCGHGERVNGSY